MLTLQSINSPSVNTPLIQGTYAIPKSDDASSSFPAGPGAPSTSLGGGGGVGSLFSGGGGGGLGGTGIIGGKAKKSKDDAALDVDMDDDEDSMDWWTKYFASVDAMIEVMQSQKPL